jgi:hypothetical protein
MIDTFQHSRTAQRRSWIPPVTITIGFACRDAIIFASDSSMTVHDSDATLDAEKIVQVKFADGLLLLAKSGDKEIGDGFEGELVEAAKDKFLADAQTVASEVLDKYRSGIAHGSYLPDIDPQERDKFFRLRKTDFLIGFYQEKPCLFSASLDMAYFIPAKPAFRAFGEGRNLANYIARGVEMGSLPLNAGQAMAAYLVTSCILHSPPAKKPLQMGIITRDGAKLLEKSAVSALYAYAEKTDEELRKFLAAFLNAQFFIQSGGNYMPEDSAF